MAETVWTGEVTGYGSYDNTPAGYNIAHPDAQHPQTKTTLPNGTQCWGAAYGDGSWEYPLVAASDIRVVPAGTKLYDEISKRYYRVGDDCAACQASNPPRLDLYVGGDLTPTTAKVNAVNQAASNLTRIPPETAVGRRLILNPDPGKPVPVLGPFSGISSGCGNFGQPDAGGTTQPPPPSGTPTLLYEDTFPGTALDTAKWKTLWFYETNDFTLGYVTGERQAYVRHGTQLEADIKAAAPGYDPHSIDANGDLVLRAIRTPASVASQVGNAAWVSGMINSQGINVFGAPVYLEAEIQLPNVAGTLPAFWLLEQNEATSDELDIMEVPKSVDGSQGRTGTITYLSVHQRSGGTSDTSVSKDLPALSTGFHKFGVMWTDSTIQAYLDRVAFGNPITTPPGFKSPKKFYVIINLAIGGEWPGDPPASVSDISMKVRAFRAYTGVPAADTTTPPPPPPPPPPPTQTDTLVKANVSQAPWASDANRPASATATSITGNGSGLFVSDVAVPAGATSYDYHAEFQAGSASVAWIGVYSPSGAQETRQIDLNTGAASVFYTIGTIAPFTATSKGSGWWEAKFAGPVDQVGTWSVWLGLADGQSGAINYRNVSFTTAGSTGGGGGGGSQTCAGTVKTVKSGGFSWVSNGNNATIAYPTAYARPNGANTAQGNGAYDNPVTVGVENALLATYPKGSILYIDSVKRADGKVQPIKRYGVVEESAAAGAGIIIWVGGATNSGVRSTNVTNAQLAAAEQAVTGTATVIVNPGLTNACPVPLTQQIALDPIV